VEDKTQRWRRRRRSSTRRRRGTMKGRLGTTRMRWWGVTDLLQDPHPQADTGLATSFAIL
jgi:hypothetical protein